MALVGGAFEVAAGNWGHKHKLYQLPPAPAPPHFTLFSVSVSRSNALFTLVLHCCTFLSEWLTQPRSTTITYVGLVLRTNTCTASTLEISAIQQRLNWSQSNSWWMYLLFMTLFKTIRIIMKITAFELVPVYLLSSNIVIMSNLVHHNRLHQNSLVC